MIHTRYLLESMCTIVAFVFILMACVELRLCDAGTVVDAYRLFQYDMSGAQFGSRLAAFNHHASSLHFAPAADLSRTVLIIPVRELNLTFVKECIAQRQPLGGLLFLLPQMLSRESKGGIGRNHLAREKELVKTVLVELELLLMHANVPYPVYFAFENDDINSVLASIKRDDVTGKPVTTITGGYKVVVSTPEPKKVASPIITNIQWQFWSHGWLPGLKTDGDTSQLPTIAIVASYDTFGTAPALSVGSDSSGSGVVALLEIARLFSILYSNPNTRGRYNILFGLTSGGPYNYDGTQKWLQSLEQRFRESIEYAICLNSVGSWDNELWMHVSKPPENAYVKQILEGLSHVTESLGVEVGLKHKKINISNARVAWEHEQFSRMRVTAATLSGLSVAPKLLESTGGLSDSRHFVDETAIVKCAKLVAESTARHIYGLQGKNIEIFAERSSLALNPYYVRSWLNLLSRTPRVAPFLSKNDPLVMALKQELAGHTDEVNLQHEVLNGMFTFYEPTKAQLNIYQVASMTFDLLFLLAVGVYLIVLFSVLVIITRGVDDLLSLFRRQTSSCKVKTA